VSVGVLAADKTRLDGDAAAYVAVALPTVLPASAIGALPVGPDGGVAGVNAPNLQMAGYILARSEIALESFSRQARPAAPGGQARLGVRPGRPAAIDAE